MKQRTLFLALFTLATPLLAQAPKEIILTRELDALGFPQAIPVSISGFTGDVEATLKSDLLFMGFRYTNADQAQYLITGKNDANVQGRVTDRLNRATRLAKAYTGGTPRAQAHAFADDIALALTRLPGIAQTKIAFRAEARRGQAEIYIADYDGFNARAATQDGSLTVAPCWAGRTTLFYCSYKPGRPQIFAHHLTTGNRRAVASHPGQNISPAVSPDGKRLALVLSKDGNPELYVADVDGSNLLRLTRTPQEESSPCWSPDSRSICFVSRMSGIASLYTISASGGAPKRLATPGVSVPTEPDWSPDGKWIAFTTLTRRSFDICIVPAQGGTVHGLVEGEDPVWAPNSRAILYAHGPDGAKRLSLLDVPSKYRKDLGRILESAAQPTWCRW
jgi:TolB protein